jgi:hypothetical protein
MKRVTVPGLELVFDAKSSAFRCVTPPMMPRAHFLLAAIGRRGQGKSSWVTNFLEKMKCVDRLIIVSPSAKSNKPLLDRLKSMLAPEDIYNNVDDVTILDDLVAKVDQERDDLEKYLEDMRRYRKKLKMVGARNPLFDDMRGDEDAKEPTHRWGGRIPLMCVWFDDIVGGGLTLGKGARKMTQLALIHRHMGQFKKGGAVGLSMIWCAQSYRTSAGGISKAIRNNLTLLVVFKTKSDQELQEIADEAAGQVDRETFFRIYHAAIQGDHDSLLLDLNPKPEHPSGFRKGLDTFLVPEE